jgi:uncharacterized protein (TIGR02284 family)
MFGEIRNFCGAQVHLRCENCRKPSAERPPEAPPARSHKSLTRHFGTVRAFHSWDRERGEITAHFKIWEDIMETKTALTKETINCLNDLIQVNIDSRDGFRDAAENVENLTISSLFTELSNQRNDQASELRSLVTANAQEPTDSGSFAAAAHRAWMDLRSAFGGGTAAMLSEAERGEDYIKGKYESALKGHAGSAVTDVLNRQYASVKAAHDRVRDLRDSFNET